MYFCQRTLLLSLLLLGCLSAHSIAGPVVLFDESHGQQFLSGRSGPLDLSGLASLYEANGFSVVSSSAPLSREALSAVDVLVLSGAFKPLSESEREAVVSFLEAGGGLAIMLHIAPPMRDLLHQLEVDFTNGTLHEARQVLGGNPLNFKVSSLTAHPVTRGLQSFAIYGSWALRGTADHTRIIAETSPHAWVDLDHNNQLSHGDAVQAFGVMVCGETGRGRYIVIGDDAVFQNRFLDEQNRQLALQLAGWLSFRPN